MKTLIILIALLFVPAVCWGKEVQEPPVTIPNATKPVADPVAQAIGLEPDKAVPHDDSKTKKKNAEKKLFAISSVTYPGNNWMGHGWHQGYGGYGDGWGDYHHASTAGEGYLSGYGRLYRGYGQYLVSRGMYLNLYQDARHRAIVNHRDAVHTWWQLKDEYKERFRRDNPTYLERQERRFDTAIRAHEIQEKEKKLIAAGILPPREPSSFTYQGITYPSYKAFKSSPGWINMKMESMQNIADRKRQAQEQEERYRQALQKFEESRNTVKGSTY